MTDENPSDGDGPVRHTDASSRRQVLQLVTAGAVGGAVGVGLARVTGGDDGTDERQRLRAPPEGDSRSYDVVLRERDGEYRANNSDDEVIHSGSDGWTVLEDSIGAVPEGGSILVSGRYGGASPIEIGKSIRMDGQEAFVDHQATGEFAFRFEGEERRQTRLAEAAAPGDNAVELDDASGMEKGDMVLLEEDEGDPVLGRQQPPGEPHSVLEVDGSSVRLEDSIVWRDGYPSGTLVYVIDPIEVHVSGFNLASPAKDGNYAGLTAHMCRDSIFENLWLDKFGSRAIMLEACANVRVRDCTVLQSSNIEAADGYGIQVWAGCHDVIVEGCVAKECRHPLSVTPGGPRDVASRTITFRDCFVTADGAAALNCHGGAAHDVRFEGCMIHTWGESGVRTGAQETNVSGCEFRMNGNSAIGTRNDGQEMIVTVTDTDIFGAGRAVHLDGEEEYEFDPLWKRVHVEGVRAYGCNRFFELENDDVDRLRSFVIRGCYWDAMEEFGLRLQSRIDGGIIEGNDFGGVSGNAHIRASPESGTDVQNVQIAGNRFRQPMDSDTFIRLANSERCVVSENKFEADSDMRIYVDDANSTANIIKQNTYFAPNPSADPVDEADGSLATDNYVYDTEAETWR